MRLSLKVKKRCFWSRVGLSGDQQIYNLFTMNVVSYTAQNSINLQPSLHVTPTSLFEVVISMDGAKQHLL